MGMVRGGGDVPWEGEAGGSKPRLSGDRATWDWTYACALRHSDETHPPSGLSSPRTLNAVRGLGKAALVRSH